MIGQANSVLSNFCCFLLKNAIFWLKNTLFDYFGPFVFFNSKIFFHYHFILIFFWVFKLSTISIGQLSNFLSIFLWFFASKTMFLPFFHPKNFLQKNFFRMKKWQNLFFEAKNHKKIDWKVLSWPREMVDSLKIRKQ